MIPSVGSLVTGSETATCSYRDEVDGMTDLVRQSGRGISYMALLIAVSTGTALPVWPQSLVDHSQIEEELALGLKNAVDRYCPVAGHDVGKLFAAERLQVDRMRRSPDASAWIVLGCLRVRLHLAGAIAHQGPEMPSGTSWHLGAINALSRVEPLDSAATTILGWLVLNEHFLESRVKLRVALRDAVSRGDHGIAAMRACAVLSREMTDMSEGGACSREALLAGVDSTWHLLELARRSAINGDTVAAISHFDLSLDAAAAIDWSYVSWHLGWFLEPEEQVAWDLLTDDTRAAWVRDRLAARDVRDGRPKGSRLVEHFSRLSYIDANFRVMVPRRELGRFRYAATPISTLREQDWIRSHWEPGLAAAKPFRFYQRGYPEYDDRAAVWMRFGEPARRIPWSGRDRERLPRIDPPALDQAAEVRRVDRPFSSNTREVWRYDLDGNTLLLHFEAEAFSASAEATRLVVGVLGRYLCDVDTVRCNLTMRATIPDKEGLPPERVTEIERYDLDHLSEATTKDDNSLRPEHQLRVVASLHRLWNSGIGPTRIVVPYAVRIRDLDRTGDSVVVALTLRQWGARSGVWREQQEVRRLLVPGASPSDAWITGYLEAPAIPDLSSWSVVAEQNASRRGRAWLDGIPALDGPDGIELSDLVAGDEAQGQRWMSTQGEQVVLAPLGNFSRNRPVVLTWQVRSRDALENVVTTIALARIDGRGAASPALEVTTTGQIDRGFSQFRRDLGIERLDTGTYRIELTLRLPDGRLLRRSKFINIV
ncbi:MAG TPA: hypothetical protein PLL69_02065 [Gemmatimonadales bacterium]|nr:hypothetical protein [Gemmatimonadales bacterium]